MDSPGNFNLSGHGLRCSHCRHDRFHRRRLMLYPAHVLLNPDLFAQTADVYVCANCGFLHWFLAPDADDVSEAATCLECGQSIPAGSDTCPACGWTYRSDGV